MFKVVTKKQNGQDVIVGWVPQEAATVEGADLHEQVFPSQACPEPSKEVRKFIEENSHRSFDLHKMVDGLPTCRSVLELQDSEWIDWNYNWKPEEPEEPLVEVVEGDVE